jgi:hypothetical protein
VLVLGGCVRAAKLPGAPVVLAPNPTRGELVEVTVDAGYPGEEPTGWAPAEVVIDGQTWERPVSVTTNARIRLAPRVEGLAWRVYVQSSGLLERRGFQPVPAVRGSLSGRLENELRLFPQQLDGPQDLVVRDLANPWNPSRFDHADLLLVRLRAPDGREADLVLENRRVGLHTGGSAGVLVRIPMAADTDVTPILTVGPTLGWRAPSRKAGWRLLDRVVLVGAVGIGSTEVPSATEELTGVFDAALVGGGLAFVDVVSVQALANASALWRDANEASWTPAIGIDALGVANLFHDAVEKVGRRQPLSEPGGATASP